MGGTWSEDSKTKSHLAEVIRNGKVWMKQLEVVWENYNDFPEDPATGTASKASKSAAKKFIKHLCELLEIEFTDELADNRWGSCEPQDSGGITRDAVVQVVVEAVAQAQTHNKDLKRLLFTRSLLFNKQSYEAILSARNSNLGSDLSTTILGIANA